MSATMPAASRAVALVLAAGSSRRFGSTKQLVEVNGRPLVAHAVAAASSAGVASTLVVVGHDGEAVARAARREGPVEVVPNPDHATGIASSLRAGIKKAADNDHEIAVVLLADQPGIDPQSIRAVVATITRCDDAARAVYDDGPGHPVAFARRTWPDLIRLEGDKGARTLLRRLKVVDVALKGVRPPDVDRPSDLSDAMGLGG